MRRPPHYENTMKNVWWCKFRSKALQQNQSSHRKLTMGHVTAVVKCCHMGGFSLRAALCRASVGTVVLASWWKAREGSKTGSLASAVPLQQATGELQLSREVTAAHHITLFLQQEIVGWNTIAPRHQGPPSASLASCYNLSPKKKNILVHCINFTETTQDSHSEFSTGQVLRLILHPLSIVEFPSKQWSTWDLHSIASGASAKRIQGACSGCFIGNVLTKEAARVFVKHYSFSKGKQNH